MKLFSIIALLFFCPGISAQSSFNASYNGTYIIPGQTFSLNIDKNTEAILLSTDSNWRLSLLDKISYKIQWRMELTSVDTITHYHTIPVNQPNFININYSAISLKRVGNKIYRLQPNGKTYIPDEVQQNLSFKLTGAQKEVLSYKCFEAIAYSASEKLTIWICYDLPSNLTPGIITNLPGAVLDYKTSTHHYIISSFQHIIK